LKDSEADKQTGKQDTFSGRMSHAAISGASSMMQRKRRSYVIRIVDKVEKPHLYNCPDEK
jgi:hypothetical protein